MADATTEEFDLDNAQCNLDEALKAARAVVAALDCAESCETAEDYFVNVQEAKDMAAELKKELAELQSAP